MIYYKDYDYSIILDRPDLAYSPYIAALDLQLSHHTPYLWSFTLDSTGAVAYGRTFAELIEFLQELKEHMHLSCSSDYKHLLIVMVPDLFTFFGATKKVLPYSREPFVAKSGSDILLATLLNVYQMHSYKAYFESELEDDMLNNYGIITPEIHADALSASCELTEDELSNSENRVYYMTCAMREELDLKYQGAPGSLVLTKTSRVNRLFYQQLRQSSNKAKCNLQLQIIKKNPIASEQGREFFLPLMYKAFIGGCVFYEEGVPDVAFEEVFSVDMTSAYVASMVLSRYPIGKFFEMQLPGSYKDLFAAPYTSFAMLITFDAEDVELRPGGLPFLPTQLRTHYVDLKDKDAAADYLNRASSTRLRRAHRLSLTLTDVDFKLFCENYKPKRIRILNVLGSKYGYLPDYVQNVIIQLYSSKADAKRKKQELEELGELSLDAKLEYNRIKTELARLYGIFTKKPIVAKYEFDTTKKEPVIVDNYYISENAKYSPVLYQWGVWTTALVRKEIAGLRRRLMAASNEPGRDIRVLSGDTDNINYTGEANDIIQQYNANVKAQIERRSRSLGIDPDVLKDLGALTIAKYKKYKLTGLKQYCYIRESKSGDVFEYKVGGMSQSCKYFDINFKTPEQRFNHFGLGLCIPAEYEPRVLKMPTSEPHVEEWTDRDGNRCRSEVLCYVKRVQSRFTLYPALEADPALVNPIKPGEKITVNELDQLARKIRNPIYNPLNYIDRRYIKK